jgi:demethylmenaquinone methyltransferase/2-methoxy-6-polyprenyl-1,4-benzoquinol methylase
MTFRLPTSQEKNSYVHNQFERIAGRYDLTNDVISLGLHRRWKRAAVKALGLRPAGSYLDVCCGTGDLALQIASELEAAGKVTGLDFSGNMLAVASARGLKAQECSTIASRLEWVQGDAQALPFPDNSFDGAIISFGLRNLTDLQRGLSEMARVVKPGGRVINLDVGHPRLPLFTPAFKFYFGRIVPLIGAIIQKDKQAYTYLPESAKAFARPEELISMLAEAGLKEIQLAQLALGSVAMQVGTKA